MKDSDFKQLKIVSVEYDKAWSYCIYHKDTVRPNLSISLLDRYYGRYKCWACSAEGNLTKEQMSKLNLSNTVYKNNIHNLHTLWHQHTESCHKNLQRFPLLKLGLAKELNISIRSLDDWLIGYDGNSFTIPMIREDLPEYYRESGFCGIQRRFSDGSKRCITGSHLGLMYPYNRMGDYYIFICEGFSDAISLWDLGLQSIARPHCRYTEGIGDYCTDGILIGVEKIIIIPDNDTVGIEGAKQLQDELRGLYFDNDEWGDGIIDVILFPFDGAKDIRQLIQLKGKKCVRKYLMRTI
jgi:hypothetical protein